MAAFETLRLDWDDPIAHLALNRPAQLNAINRQMLEDLAAACEIVASGSGTAPSTGSRRCRCPSSRAFTAWRWRVGSN